MYVCLGREGFLVMNACLIYQILHDETLFLKGAINCFWMYLNFVEPLVYFSSRTETNKQSWGSTTNSQSELSLCYIFAENSTINWMHK